MTCDFSDQAITVASGQARLATWTAYLVMFASLGHAQELGPEFVKDDSFVDLGQVRGLPPRQGGLVPLVGDSETLLIGGNANTAAGKLYSVKVTPDETRSIVALGADVYYADAPFNDGGLVYAGNGTLLCARWPVCKLGLLRRGNRASGPIIDLGSPSNANSLASLRVDGLSIPKPSTPVAAATSQEDAAPNQLVAGRDIKELQPISKIRQLDDQAGDLLARLARDNDETRQAEVIRLRDAKGSQFRVARAAAVALVPRERQEAVRQALVERFARLTPRSLQAKLNSDDLEMRGAAIRALAVEDTKDLMPQLIAMLGDRHIRVSRAARKTLCRWSREDFGPNNFASAGERFVAQKRCVFVAVYQFL